MNAMNKPDAGEMKPAPPAPAAAEVAGPDPAEIERLVEARLAERLEAERQARREARSAIPDYALSARHTELCRLLPDRFALLERLPRHAICAEIGVAFGDFTAEILNRCDPFQLHLIDAWATERYAAGLDRIRDAHAVRLREGGLKINRGMSVDVMESYADNFFDWVYIDTDHSYETTLRELRIASRITRPSGRIAGHDHCTGNIVKPWGYGVVQAVCQFCVEAGWGYEYLTAESHGHASFCLVRL